MLRGFGMKKILRWWKKEAGISREGKRFWEKRYVTLAKSLLLALLPLLCCVVYCASQGRGIGEVYLPSSVWNDELFYYKQVEGIVNYGYPQGYFGFNESHALKLSFAAWSPVLVFPWIIWGFLFGWNLMSPVICNIFLMMLCCFLFVWLVRPSWKQLGILTFLFCLYTPFVRYMLSSMPEVICFAMLIIFYALAVNYQRREKTYKLVLLFVLSGVMTLMRPYLLLFLLLPVFFWIRAGRNFKSVAGSLAVFGTVLGLYGVIKHYLGAEYFAPLFFTDWIDTYFEQGLWGGIRNTLDTLYYMGKDFLEHTRQGIREGLASGAFFGGYLVCMAVLAVQSVRDWRRYRRMAGEKGQEDWRKALGRWLVIEAHLAFSFAAMLAALLLMYKLTEGSKHLLTFMAAAIFVIALMDTGFYKKAMLVGGTFAYFYIHMAVDPYDYQVPFVQEERMAALEACREILREELILDPEKVPGYENALIWVYSDSVGGEPGYTAWQLLYALPEGFGISCCMPDFVSEEFDSLQGRYLCVISGGSIEEKCIRAGYEKILEAEGSVFYRRY